MNKLMILVFSLLISNSQQCFTQPIIKYLELEVKNVTIFGNQSKIRVLSNHQCDKYTLNPGQITIDMVAEGRFPMSVIGKNCRKITKNTLNLTFSEVREKIYDFVKEGKEKVVLLFDNGRIRKPISI